MKTFKLLVHQKTFSEDEVIINSKDYPGLNCGDVIEVYSLDNEFSRLLLQIKSFSDDKKNSETVTLKDKPSISIEYSITNTFQLRSYADVIVNKIDANSVVLDSVELIFKDQYLSRSDMWRIRNFLKNSVVFLNKKFEKHIRFQVFEMWSQGVKVASGFINNETKIVFRSASSMVYLFIQMSSEMWDFDVNGDLYFEKAVNGFLNDLFEKWKRFSCNHDVTIVLFSRTYYDAQSIEEFPDEMRDCLQQDYRGKFYEDFYRVAIQNERYDEWNSTIILLKKLFNSYEREVIRIHEKFKKNSTKTIPNAFNSTASQGNFLEVLNMSLNVFEKHYLDRSFDRTGQLSIVISPSTGVFEVDQDLTSITKQRIIDNGIGSDLVCLGEQPLHAVPLFKFNRKPISSNETDQNFTNFNQSTDKKYNMPHWINLSFYTSERQSRFSTFIPRIKMPNIISNKTSNNFDTNGDKTQPPNQLSIQYLDHSRSWFLNDTLKQQMNTDSSTNEAHFDNAEIDYDRYDCEIFTSSSSLSSLFNQQQQQQNTNKSISTVRTRKKSVVVSPFSNQSTATKTDENKNTSNINPIKNSRIRKLDELDSPKKKINRQDEQDLKDDFKSTRQQQSQQLRKSINPFNPKHIPFKLTSNRRRWTHVFPLGSNGIYLQQHHYHLFPQNTASTLIPINHSTSSSNDLFKMGSSFQLNNSFNLENLSLLNAINISEHNDTTDELDTITNDLNQIADQNESNFLMNLKDKRSISLTENKSKNRNYSSINLIYDQNEEKDENFVLTSGITRVDWKSLIIPACLPLTTDFLPDSKTLENDYLDSEYSLIPELQSAELYARRCYKDEDHHNHNPLKTDQVFQEFICQRLQQGFQVVMNRSTTNLINLQTSTPLQSNTPNISSNQSSKIDNLTIQINSNNSSNPMNDEPNFIIMSIGRILHRLSLDVDNNQKDNTIKVKTYRPRISLNNNIKIHYCYRFRAPDQESYIVSWVDFVTERLENYNWSYLDHYICLRGGEDEYELRENLKFWRLRMLLLPSMQQQTKQILENITSNNDDFVCDIYSKINNDERLKLQKGFLKFFYIINRIKNQPPNKSTKESIMNKPTNLNEMRRFSSGFTSSSLITTNQINQTNTRDRISSGNQMDKSMRRSTLTSFSNKDDDNPINEIEFRNSNENLDHLVESIKKLNQNNLNSIVDAMKNGFNGFQFLPKQGYLPNHLFISADAVQWSIQSIEGITNEQQSLNLFQKLLDHKLISHASGRIDYPFKYGFFLYFIVMKNIKQLKDNRDDLEMYKREWFEVEIKLISNSSIDNGSINQSQQSISFDQTQSQPPLPPPQFKYSRLRNPINSFKSSLNSNLSNFNNRLLEPDANNKQTTKGTNYYKSVLDTDFGSKSKRAEWLHIKYQQIYNPIQAFEIVLEWMVSTSNQIAEIVQGWARKAGSTTGLHLVPIPSDPFALPFYSKSDPLRTPIYVQINFDCLSNQIADQLLTNENKLFRFREEILCRFGFLPFLGGFKKDQKQYVHVSGSIFVLIPNYKDKESKKDAKDFSNPTDSTKISQFDDTSEEKYLTRHFSGSKQNKKGLENIRTGFHWSWNYMISKRWKSPTTGDETFQRRVLKDFKMFCSNDRDRLRNFADEIQSLILG